MNASKLIIPILIFAVVVSCKPDKKAELEKLKKKQKELALQISAIEKELGDTTTVDKSLQVSVADITPTVFKHYIEVQGKLDGEENVDVQPEGAGGTVREILVRAGQAVSKGQVLARLNDVGLRDQLKALESTYTLAKENFERTERLWQQKIGSEMNYLSAKSNKEALEGQIGALKEQISMMNIKSPINGTVEEVNIKVGQITSPQLPIPAFRVVNFNSLKVKAEVAEAYASRVKVGDNVLIFFPDLSKEIDAKITTASRVVSPTNRTFTVESYINPDKNGFKANMIAVLKINDYKAENATVIPINYIQTDLSGNFVYVAEKNNNSYVAKKVYIEQGQSYNGAIEITKGLKAGDKVVTSGYLDLEEGEKIRF